MTIWFLFGLMTVGAVFAVLWPLRSGARRRAGGGDVAVYREQLAELERDRAAGLIGAAEGEAARVEIARRLLAAAARAEERRHDDPGETIAPAWRSRRLASLGALVILPALALALYGWLGSPSLPGAPHAAQNGKPGEARSIETLLAQVESHLARTPDDGRGWEVIAPVYMGLGRFEDAARARASALRLNGATAARESDYGEALTAAANGVVTAEAKAAFERARALDPKDVKARFLLGLAAEQDGRTGEAARMWRELLADAPPGARWTEAVAGALSRIEPASARGPGPSAEDIAGAAQMSPEARAAMVRGMVKRLSTRLQQDGSDIEGWVRLVRAYVMLGEPEKARGAVSDARRAIAGDPEKLRRLNDAAKQFGLES